MKVFSRLYEMVLRWADHPLATRYLAGLSVIESAFAPVPPPDVMLIPMTLKQPHKGMSLALWTTVFSVIGGLIGYLIGYFAFEIFQPYLHEMGYWEKFQIVVEWFKKWGFSIVFIAGFSPLPYKLFTIAAGTLKLSLIPFLLASVIGRGSRFFLVAILVMKFGPSVEPVIRKYVEWLGWATVALLALAIYWVRGG
ncbi:MAG: DedA family protein [Gammaproteobacteria bacterium]|nr:DedA family protein [Gammaproteobacteria bacterium]